MTATVADIQTDLKAPFPWFGGKSRVSGVVWDRFGNVDNYVEPFAGSLAVLLNRPHPPQTETVNDLDCYLANFWRALSVNPHTLAHHADWPVNEADLHARHLWLVNRDAFRERMKTDPDFYDAKIAGWWVWGISQWIGSGWCSRPEWTERTNAGTAQRGIFRQHQFNPTWQARPFLTTDGQGVHAKTAGRGVNRKLPAIGDAGRGVPWQIPSLRGDSGASGMGIFSNSVINKRPMIHGGHTGKGVHAENPGVSSQFGTAQKRPHLSGRGTGIGIHGDEACSALEDYMQTLAARLRRVRVCCGDWRRVTGPSVTVKHGVCGVFLDPPYDMRVVSNAGSGRDGAAPSDGLYSSHSNDVSAEVRAWAIENGDNPLLRVALCGYEGEHAMPSSWECIKWKAHGGYGSQRGDASYENAARERIWFSPHCLKEGPLFRQGEL